MPSLIRPGSVKVVTQDGEIHVAISLELNINLNTDGVIRVTAETEAKKESAEKAENTAWAIPDFTPTRIDFGKRE